MHWKRLFITLSFCLIASWMYVASDAEASRTSLVDPMRAFTRLVRHDDSLSGNSKIAWIRIARTHFRSMQNEVDFSSVLHRALHFAVRKELGIEAAVAATLCIGQVQKQGIATDTLLRLVETCIRHGLGPESLAFLARALEAGDRSGVPDHVLQTLIALHLKEDWPRETFFVYSEGLCRAVEAGLDAEVFLLYTVLSHSLNPDRPQAVADDAFRSVARRAGRSSATSPLSYLDSTELDYRSFMESIATFLGTPYDWGGTDRNGADCSGFIQLVMQENGVEIPRVSRDQARFGQPVERTELRIGDLVFFDTEGHGTITHVGLYLGGNLMAHASSTRGVVIVWFDNRYFQKRFLTARRILAEHRAEHSVN